MQRRACSSMAMVCHAHGAWRRNTPGQITHPDLEIFLKEVQSGVTFWSHDGNAMMFSIFGFERVGQNGILPGFKVHLGLSKLAVSKVRIV